MTKGVENRPQLAALPARPRVFHSFQTPFMHKFIMIISAIDPSSLEEDAATLLRFCYRGSLYFFPLSSLFFVSSCFLVFTLGWKYSFSFSIVCTFINIQIVMKLIIVVIRDIIINDHVMMYR